MLEEQQMLVVNGIRIAFFNLLVVAAIGCLLRYSFLNPIGGLNYSYVLHAHSHLAFLGWVFMALYVLIVHTYGPIEKTRLKKYIVIFAVLQVANLGMLFTFPFTGYALWSIIFSAMHALVTMIFAWIFIKEAGLGLKDRHRPSFQFVKWGLILMFISNLAPFALGPVSAMQGKSDLYYSLIYFYLHFQYNGWFTFALIGLLVYQLEKEGVNTSAKLLRTGFRMKLIAIFPAYILSLLWTGPNVAWYLIGGLAAMTQLIGLTLILVFVFQHIKFLFRGHSDLMKALFWVGVLAIGLQHVLMLLSSFPSLAGLAFAKNIVIAYLHMVLIGFVTIWIFYHILNLGILKENISSRLGFGFFLSAFIATELILIFQGFVDQATGWLFSFALVQLLALIIISLSVKKNKAAI